MSPRKTCVVLAIVGVVLFAAGAQSYGQENGPIVAVSMREMARAARRGGGDLEAARRLCEAGTIVGAVHDAENGLVLVLRADGGNGVSLDEIVVALRSEVLAHEAPSISIEPGPDTGTTAKWRVVVGGIRDLNSAFTARLLAADQILKALSMGTEDATALGVPSYFELIVRALKGDPNAVDRSIACRFWFAEHEAAAAITLSIEAGSYVARDLPIVVKPQAVHAGNPGIDRADVRDHQADEWAAVVNEKFDALAQRFPEIQALGGLFDAAALAYAASRLAPAEELQYWVHEYRVANIPVETEGIDPIERSAPEFDLKVVGGVDLETVRLQLDFGDARGFRDAVLRSRPDQATAAWRIPILDDWGGLRHAPKKAAPASTERALLPTKSIGAFVLKSSVKAPTPFILGGVPARPSAAFSMPVMSSLPPTPLMSSRIGGVWLHGPARVDGALPGPINDAHLDVVSGEFSLLVAGRNVALPLEDQRRFVTALWMVYYGIQPPGLSLDPSPDPAVQLVRLIGHCVGNAIYRDMLICDYYMKKVAAGLERPAIPGFRSLDELVARYGMSHEGAGRRFWFCSEGMTFRACGDAIVFESGRMQLLTEKMLAGQSGVTDTADREFARQWTDHYWAIAAASPPDVKQAFCRLFLAARDVALARYLKQSGVPMQGFLLAHRHLVMFETIEPTVPTLRAPSKIFKNVEWFGGIDLSVDMNRTVQGRYVTDDVAARTLRQEAHRFFNVVAAPATPPGVGTRGFGLAPGARPITLGRQSFSVLRSTAVARGINVSKNSSFNTDLAFRANDEPGVELVRRHLRSGATGELGSRWTLFLPLALHVDGDEWTDAAVLKTRDPKSGVVAESALRVPRRLKVIDAVDGRHELLQFDAARAVFAAWYPMSRDSHYRQASLLVDGSILVEETNGLKVRFDPGLRLIQLVFSADHMQSFEWSGNRVTAVRDGFGGEIILHYADDQLLRSAAGPFGKVEYRYVENELVSVRQPSGRRLVMIYDPLGGIDDVLLR